MSPGILKQNRVWKFMHQRDSKEILKHQRLLLKKVFYLMGVVRWKELKRQHIEERMSKSSINLKKVIDMSMPRVQSYLFLILLLLLVSCSSKKFEEPGKV